MWHIVVSCAALLNLSASTQIEMNHIIPHVGEFCLTHRDAKLSIVYGPFVATKKSDIMRQGLEFREANDVGNRDSTNGGSVLR